MVHLNCYCSWTEVRNINDYIFRHSNFSQEGGLYICEDNGEGSPLQHFTKMIVGWGIEPSELQNPKKVRTSDDEELFVCT